ncbi:RNA 2',3'-cyclic phosphodiesterase [Pseudomonas guariconensis]|uniref:RNA 2',3'-cyclic phosphodiesterase n=1 Tax=Pseudomonas TaxID=286 RepID=UPI001CE3DEFC|nr:MULTISPECIES: RNA 2',3'-cyclic phosphodiesterase [Pseudomonas]MCO7514467.1 RNA 2',3'-cyclic phosphodiesterase [Pseudomonas putida]MCO7595703.1 RNA 2',3'-cyclic phosphodiesterase [Pseudomonas guariconensis]MCO7604520.1 RNA 2',3'-cyclic phosphodiesterase [Pseudomonas guariconensis]MCO7633145.1 RNA 2',3'-cyclic phosphodiesterase [Pseudomonas guariconensis]MCU7220390.1 RNA 2',3'-cyclic phosphodiesterase [Pseudomonas brassicacearum]
MAQDSRPSGAPFKRLFFALPVSDAQRRAIAQWRRSLGLRSGRPVPAENFHLTLLFLGDVDAARLPALCAAVDNLTRPDAPLRLLLDRLQVWQRAGVLVLEPGETPPALRQLVYALQQAALPLGIAEQVREYRPHLTLSRDFRGQPPEAAAAPAFFLAVRHFTLYESRKGRYWPLAEWSLTG